MCVRKPFSKKYDRDYHLITQHKVIPDETPGCFRKASQQEIDAAWEHELANQRRRNISREREREQRTQLLLNMGPSWVQAQAGRDSQMSGTECVAISPASERARSPEATSSTQVHHVLNNIDWDEEDLKQGLGAAGSSHYSSLTCSEVGTATITTATGGQPMTPFQLLTNQVSQVGSELTSGSLAFNADMGLQIPSIVTRALDMEEFLLAKRPPWHAQALVNEARRQYNSCAGLEIGVKVVAAVDFLIYFVQSCIFEGMSKTAAMGPDTKCICSDEMSKFCYSSTWINVGALFNADKARRLTGHNDNQTNWEVHIVQNRAMIRQLMMTPMPWWPIGLKQRMDLECPMASEYDKNELGEMMVVLRKGIARWLFFSMTPGPREDGVEVLHDRIIKSL